MAKLDGINPRAGRKTLGQAMQELVDGSQVDKATQDAHLANHGAEGSDSEAARHVMARNNYPNSDNSLQDSANAVPYLDGRPLNQGLVDVSPAGLKAVGSMVRDTMIPLNDYIPPEVAGEATGGRRGDSIPFADTNNGKTFLRGLTTDGGIDQVLAKVNFDQLSGGASSGVLSGLLKNQGGFFTAPQIQKIIDKIGSSGDTKKTSLLLASVNGEGGADPNARPKGAIAAEVHDNLDSTNRYAPSPQSPYIKDSTSQDETVFFKDGLYSIQVGAGQLGVYDKNGKGVTTIDLSKMAMQLMVSAQSHSGLADMIDDGFAKGQAGAGSFLFDLAALVPGLTQIGAARIEQNLMRIKNTHTAGELGIAGGGSDDFFPVASGDVILGAGPAAKTDGTIDPRSAGSYGQMNSFVEPFNGAMPFGMFFIALYSILGVLLVSFLITAITTGTGLGPEKNSGGGSSTNPYTLELGYNSRGGGDDSITSLFFQLFGLPRLDFNPYTCLLRGIERFYDIPSVFDLAGNFEGVLEAAVNLAMAPGYYATVTKQVLRDFEQVTESILALGQNASVFNVIAGIMKVVETLFASFTFRFCVFLMNLGNIDLLSRKSFGVAATGDLVAPVDDVSKGSNAKIAATAYSRMRLSRFGGSSNPLGLQFHPAVFNVPAFALKGQGLGGNFGLAEKGKDIKAVDIAKDLSKSRIQYKGRISKDQLRAVEDALDVEYMPFYVHDLRTDEVFSMPAFISGFTEDFSPEYNETHGYGRTDPVMIYSKTKRNMSIDFSLVAYSRADHDYMWFIINKLVAMCYPQRSSGQKRVLDGEDKFIIQPFSQVPTASPLIRLRLGEVIKSNYSKLALARLFGLLGAPGRSNLDGEPSQDLVGTSYAEVIANEVAKVNKAAIASVTNGEDPGLDMIILPQQSISVSNGNGTVRNVMIQRTRDGTELNSGWGGIKIKSPKIEKFTGAKGKPMIRVTGEVASKGFFDSVEDVKEKLSPLGAAAIKQLFPKIDDIPPNMAVIPTVSVKATVEFSGYDGEEGVVYRFDPDALRNEADSNVDAPFDPSNQVFVDFMKAENNPIVASFESARGRGLAGVITSLSFDYADVPWETDPGNRAPMVVNVSLAFNPIHDLPLGMDADGKLIAPSHPVGNFAMTDPYNDMESQGSNAIPGAELGSAISKSFKDSIGSRDNVNVK